MAGMAAYSPQKNDIISKYKALPIQQLFDTAGYYYYNNSFDTALVCYSLLINTPVKDSDTIQQKTIIEAYIKAAIIYYYLSDYRDSYELLIKALHLCEAYHHAIYEPKIYTNIGNIYFCFKKYDVAKSYFSKALNMSQSIKNEIILLINIGLIEISNGTIDSASYFLNQALNLCIEQNEAYLYSAWNNMAFLYQKTKAYDSAFYYYHLSLNDSRKKNKIVNEAENLSQLGELFFEVNKIDSALYYINLSNLISKKNNFLGILKDNYLILSKIEESRGKIKKAFQYYKEYAELRDSVINAEKFGEINQLQRLYEISKTNQQIEQLTIEQQINERTIHYQKIIQFIILSVLLLVSAVLLIIFFQKRDLNSAYKSLFEKNIKLIDYQKNTVNTNHEKYKKSALTDNMQEELLNKILMLMEDASIFCDTNFSVDRLAELVQSNQKYVSQVINAALKKNFRSFLNDYRVREAQLLLSEPDAIRYTIESIAFRVGFKSRNAFRDAFKEITGVSPNFYLRSMQKQNIHHQS
jgi:AraC-like DNA-binding protein/Tfp pilus assembly protein PilF